MDSGPSYFGRYQNQAVITRAERPDIQMASLMCDTKCLVPESILSPKFRQQAPAWTPSWPNKLPVK